MLTTTEMSLNVKFASIVKKRQCLYDSRVPTNKSVIQKAWEEIAEEMEKIYEERGEAGISVEDCIQKWKCLRRCYLRHLKKCPSKNAGEYTRRFYYLEDAMEFLQPHLSLIKHHGAPNKSLLYGEELRSSSIGNDNSNSPSSRFVVRQRDKSESDDCNHKSKEDSPFTSECNNRLHNTSHNEAADFYSDSEDIQSEHSDFRSSWVDKEQERLKQNAVTPSLKLRSSDSKNNASAKKICEVPSERKSTNLRMINQDSSKFINEDDKQMNNRTESLCSENLELGKKEIRSQLSASNCSSSSNHSDVPVIENDDERPECQLLAKNRQVTITLVRQSLDMQSKGIAKRQQEFSKPSETKYINTDSSQADGIQGTYISNNRLNSVVSSEHKRCNLQHAESSKDFTKINQEMSHCPNETESAKQCQLSANESTAKQSETIKVIDHKSINWYLTNMQEPKTTLLPSARICTTSTNIQRENQLGVSVNAPRQIANNNRVINTPITHEVRNRHQVFPVKLKSNKAGNFKSYKDDTLDANAEKKLNIPAWSKGLSLSFTSNAAANIITEKVELTSPNVLGSMKKDKPDFEGPVITKAEKADLTNDHVLGNMKREQTDNISSTLVKEEIKIFDRVPPVLLILSDEEEQLPGRDLKTTAVKPKLQTDCKESKSTNEKGIKRKKEIKKPFKNKKMKSESSQSERGIPKQQREDSRTLFIQSLLPDVRKLSDNQFRSFRKKVSDIMMEYFNKDGGI